MRRAALLLSSLLGVLAGLPAAAATAAASDPAPASASRPARMAASAASGPVVGGTAALPLRACRLAGLSHDALCGTLQRPLDPAHAQDTRQITLHVAVIPAVARQKLPDPVFFFAGGPGQSAIDLAGTVERLLRRLGARRDIVLIDQRGTGLSAPLACNGSTADEGFVRAIERPRMIAALQACRAELEQLPWGDLRFYTTAIASTDADAVRAALGLGRINLVGMSYGTRAALDYLRQYPAQVRRVVIDGVAPPDMVLPATFGPDGDAALQALISDCAADAGCREAYPDLAGTWRGLLAGLPRAIEFADPSTGQPRRMTLTPALLRGMVRPVLYMPALAAAIPHALSEAAAGRFGPLAALSGGLAGSAGSLSEGEHFSVVCAEDMPRAQAPIPADDVGQMYSDVCAHWPKGDVPADFYKIPVSPAPVLLLSGGIDPVTPPRHAERVAQALGPLARHRIVAKSGHGVMGLACVGEGVYRFLNREAQADALAVDVTACAAQVPRPPAFVPPAPPRPTLANRSAAMPLHPMETTR